MNIPTLLTRQVLERPDAVALGSPSEAVTFAELQRRAEVAGTHLLHSGVRPGDGVLLLLPVSPSLYVYLLGLFRIGAHAVLLDPSAGRDHVSRAIEMSAPVACIAGWKARLLRLIMPSLRSIPRWISPGASPPEPTSVARLPSLESIPRDAAALLTFTSGSTGQPKGMLRTHGFLLAQHAALEQAIALRPGQKDLATLPVFVLANLASGVTTILADIDFRRPGFINGGRVLHQIDSEQPDRSCGSPAIYLRLAESARKRGRQIGFLKRIYTGGAPVFPSMVRKIREASSETELVIVYGSTEAEPIAHLGSDDFLSMASGNGVRGLPAGKPVPEIQLRILTPEDDTAPGALSREEFERRCCMPGDAGEIVVSGEHVGKGYLGGIGNAENKIRVADRIWHRTGDAGWLDAAGSLWLLGRMKASVLLDNGTRLYPFEIEARLDGQPGIRRTALVQWNGKPCLAVEPEPDAGRDVPEARRVCAEFGIRSIKHVKRIPLDRRHHAKVDYPRLLTMLETARG